MGLSPEAAPELLEGLCHQVVPQGAKGVAGRVGTEPEWHCRAGPVFGFGCSRMELPEITGPAIVSVLS